MSQAHILIVDDDADLLKLISLRLQSAGYRISTATNGREALNHVALLRPDLVVSDLRMPAMDGMALLDALRNQHPTLPVILLTAHGSIPEAVSATQRGAYSFLSKPFESQTLLGEVAKALQASGFQAHADTTKIEPWRKAILSRSPRMDNILHQAKLVAASDASVLINGESGTGKELLAKAIHQASARAHAPFVAINCGAIPENLLESELFGHAKGAFTGAVKAHVGLFQQADGGTLFLDEIGDMPPSLQIKVLRALQERKIRPVGGAADVSVDVRLISATHRDLQQEMQQNRFREDLFYRINVVNLQLPSLQQRPEDISLLAQHFLQMYNNKYQKKVTSFAPEALDYMRSAAWPGNIRQLQNVIEQTVVLCTTSIIPADLVQKALHHESLVLLPLDDAKQQFEHDYLVSLLKLTQGNVAQAAKMAGRNRTEFYRLLERHQLAHQQFQNDTL